MNVLVYAGRGTSELCVKLTMSSLRKSIGRGYEVKAVDASTLTNDPWETNCALLVIPGGRDLPYVEDLSGLASKRIKRYVSEYGGSYLGICAGAYFGCREIEFDKDGPFEVTGSRPLQFFNGVAYGPIGAFKYDSHEGASAIKLNKAGQIIRAYCNGGCWFEPFAGSEVITIAAYENGEHAIVFAKAGKGKVLLSGSHIEFSASELESIRNELPFDLQELILDDEQRGALWNECLAKLELNVETKTEEKLVPTPIRVYDFSLPAEFNVQTSYENISMDISSSVFYPANSFADISPDMTFNPVKYKSLLQCSLGMPLFYAERIMSTQTLLRDDVNLLNCVPDGSIVVAGDQLAGKGRGANTWLSSTGCLQFTLVKDHDIRAYKSLSIMQYLVATSMCEALSAFAVKGEVRIKWPNDIYAKRTSDAHYKKIGGILVNSMNIDDSNMFRMLIGFGINVYDTPWSLCLNDIMACPLDKETLLSSFLNTFDRLYERMVDLTEFPTDLYYKHWLHTGETAWLEEEQIQVRIEGIDKDGYLIAVPVTEGLQTILYENGPASPRRILLQPDGNSFDLMKRLLKRK